MSFVLTQPQGGTAGIPGSSAKNILINPGNTGTVNSILLGQNISVKWIYVLMDNTATTNDVTSGEVLANHKFGSLPSHNQYGITGTTIIPHLLDVVVNAGNLELNITNNSAFQISVNVIRMELLI